VDWANYDAGTEERCDVSEHFVQYQDSMVRKRSFSNGSITRSGQNPSSGEKIQPQKPKMSGENSRSNSRNSTRAPIFQAQPATITRAIPQTGTNFNMDRKDDDDFNFINQLA
jgi:hypothetical protein